jgi:HEAT repeat protein
MRLEAVSALNKINDDRAVLPLIEALQDYNKEVRYNAVIGLGKLGGSEALSGVCRSAEKDKDNSVREMAGEICNQFEKASGAKE